MLSTITLPILCVLLALVWWGFAMVCIGCCLNQRRVRIAGLVMIAAAAVGIFTAGGFPFYLALALVFAAACLFGLASGVFTSKGTP
jgi:hypothetical membrane protein